MATLLTRAECEVLLQAATQAGDLQSGDCVLIGVQLTPAADVVGFLGEYHHLLIDYSTSEQVKQLRLFVKSLPTTNSEAEKEAIFRKEADLYATLLGNLQRYSPVKWLANCYLARPDLLVMEDLSYMGYVGASSDSGSGSNASLNAYEMRQLLRGLAAMHAASIVYEERERVDIGRKYRSMLPEITVAADVAWFTTGLRAVVEVARACAGTRAMLQKGAELQKQLEAVYEMVKPSAEYRNVICHRDPWRGNIFFDRTAPDSAGSTLFVDFQTARYCPPAIDIIFAMYMNLDRRDRLQMEPLHLRWYYQQLANDLQLSGIAASEHLTERQLFDSYEKFRLFGSVYRCVAATILLVPRAFVTNDYKFVDRTAAVLTYMRGDRQFRHHMHECIDEICQLIGQPSDTAAALVCTPDRE